MPGGNKQVTHTSTNPAAGLFKYVTFLLPPGIKGLKRESKNKEVEENIVRNDTITNRFSI